MELVNNSIYLKIPTLKDLSLTKTLLSCEKTMAFNSHYGGTVMFDLEAQKQFFNQYCTNNPNYEYFHIYNLDHVFVGEISSKYNKEFLGVTLNIKIKYEYRENHHGSDALSLYLDYLFMKKNVLCVIDDVAFDNKNAINFLESFGFREIEKTTDSVLLKLNRKDWV